MATPTKPGVDWAEIRRRFDAGESAYSLAKEYDVSKQGILKRAKSEGWKATDPGNPEHWSSATRQLPSLTELENPADRRAKLLAAYGKRSPENLDEILAMIAQGVPKTLACQSVGMAPNTLASWEDDDPSVSALIKQAEGAKTQKRIGRIEAAGARGDWKADAFLLERDPFTKPVYGSDKANGNNGPNIQVVLNIQRGSPESITIDGQVIEAAE